MNCEVQNHGIQTSADQVAHGPGSRLPDRVVATTSLRTSHQSLVRSTTNPYWTPRRTPMTEPLADFEAPADRGGSGAMKEIERLSTIEDLRRLMARYVYNADQRRWEDLASLFTIDGTFTPHNVDGSVARRMQGRAEIAESIPASIGPGAVVVHHLFSDEIDISSA